MYKSKNSNRPNLKQRITYRQILFCKNLLKTFPFNAKMAAIKAGYSPKTAKQQASRLLKTPIVDLYRSLYFQEIRHEEQPEPQPKRQKLTQKQLCFMHFYMCPFFGKPRNGKQAAIYAGYSPKTAKQTAYRLLQHPEIKAFVDSKIGERKEFSELRDRVISRFHR